MGPQRGEKRRQYTKFSPRAPVSAELRNRIRPCRKRRIDPSALFAVNKMKPPQSAIFNDRCLESMTRVPKMISMCATHPKLIHCAPRRTKLTSMEYVFSSYEECLFFRRGMQRWPDCILWRGKKGAFVHPYVIPNRLVMMALYYLGYPLLFGLVGVSTDHCWDLGKLKTLRDDLFRFVLNGLPTYFTAKAWLDN